MKNGLLRDKLIAELTKDLPPPTEEQVWVRHILVDGIDQAEEVIAKLDAGESWADLAAEYSTDLANKDNGGDLGWIGRIDSYDPPSSKPLLPSTKMARSANPFRVRMAGTSSNW